MAEPVKAAAAVKAPPTEVSAFWDNSNIWLVGRNVCHQREPGDEYAFRIDFAHLLDFAVNGRKLDYAYVGGSIPPPHDALWKRFQNLGATVETQERGAGSGGEIAVDEMIQLSPVSQRRIISPR